MFTKVNDTLFTFMTHCTVQLHVIYACTDIFFVTCFSILIIVVIIVVVVIVVVVVVVVVIVVIISIDIDNSRLIKIPRI